jgi:hypothetical protein
MQLTVFRMSEQQMETRAMPSSTMRVAEQIAIYKDCPIFSVVVGIELERVPVPGIVDLGL